MGLFDVIEDKIFDIHWHFTVERDARKSMKRFSDTMDKAITTLNEVVDKTPDTNHGDTREEEYSNEIGRKEQTISVHNDLQRLEMRDKTAILAVLVKLMAAKKPTDQQRDYFRMLKNFLDVQELPTLVPYLPRCSQEMQKSLFQIITEFLCVEKAGEDSITIRFAAEDDQESSEALFRKLRKKAGIRYEKIGKEELSGEDVLCALQIPPEEKEAMVFQTLELCFHAGAEGMIEQYSSAVENDDPGEGTSGQFPICSFEQWEQIQYELIAQDLLDSIYDSDYAEESAYKEEKAALWEEMREDLEKERYTEAEVTDQLEKNGLYIDLMRKEYEIKKEIQDMIDADPNWQETLKQQGTALYNKIEELQNYLNEGDERRYKTWMDCISKEQLTEDELWEKASQIGLIPDAEKVSRIREALREQ